MGRIVHYLMATSFVVLLIISTNSPSCQACLWPWCKPRPDPEPCFRVMEPRDCTDNYCHGVCEVNHVVSNHAYCKIPGKRGVPVWHCCCPR
ncbi:hypothetical protein SETIT_8G224200v2 [Setaria italica]|uniref:Uncharacterized protein n=1 Tax=Setaria italica TaxID=4555 RepID=K3ZKJ5_SETIT|nr:hypothetical protein SETIT_8G224200v2 [Setaria italica]